MFLQPNEVGFLKYLKEARVPVVEFEFPANKVVNVQSQLEKLIGQNYYLNKVRIIKTRISYNPLMVWHSLRKKDIGHTCMHMPHTVFDRFSTSTSLIW